MFQDFKFFGSYYIFVYDIEVIFLMSQIVLYLSRKIGSLRVYFLE